MPVSKPRCRVLFRPVPVGKAVKYYGAAAKHHSATSACQEKSARRGARTAAKTNGQSRKQNKLADGCVARANLPPLRPCRQRRRRGGARRRACGRRGKMRVRPARIKPCAMRFSIRRRLRMAAGTGVQRLLPRFDGRRGLSFRPTCGAAPLFPARPARRLSPRRTPLSGKAGRSQTPRPLSPCRIHRTC